MTAFRYTTLLLLSAAALLPSATAFGGANPADCPATVPDNDSACTGIGNFLQCFYRDQPCTEGEYQCRCAATADQPNWSCSCRGSGVKDADEVDTEAIDVGSLESEASSAASLASSIAVVTGAVVAGALL